jgi:NADPH:quinone reductase-like Zn-dependent oxidoreductase
MKKIVISAFGGAEVIEMTEVGFPSPSNKEVVIKVGFAGVNPLDWKVRSGSMKIVTGSKFPMPLGYECAGIVTDVGSDVGDFKSGDRVVASAGMKGGAYGEFVCLPAINCCKVPEKVSLKSAAGSYVCGITAHHCLSEKGKLKPEDEVMIIGASGGVGTFATQIAHISGAEITAVCSTPNFDYVKSLGAENVLDYTNDITGVDKKFDLIFDAVNAHSWKAMKPLLKSPGIYINTMPTPAAFFRQITTGLFSSKKCKTYLMRPDRVQMAWILDKMGEGAIQLDIEKVFEFDEVPQAIAENEKGHTRGKIIVKIDPSVE